ncbi:MAG: hypothetical protein ABIY70_08755 [Capsulimonas sp.]|uniref:hypothetical protein n=1 Tax=Capsulimonas sp. TaxID=2494211 RepID=UPI00326426F6
MISETAISRLPKDEPILMIEWSQEPGDVLIADYFLCLPIREGDVRSEGEHFSDGVLRIVMGSTRCTGPISKYVHEGEVSAPYRDGRHIEWDALRLNLRAFAVFGDDVTRILPAEDAWSPPAGEAEYALRLTGTQARVMDRALELYAAVHRSHLGQLEQSLQRTLWEAEKICGDLTPEETAIWNTRGRDMNVFRSLLQGLQQLIPSSYTVPELQEEALRASDMRQSFRHQFWQEHPLRVGDWTQVIPEGDQPAIAVQLVRKDQT